MERWATKDHYERETEEVDRLVRPAPKIKPPRHDLRRETVNPDSDPDIDTDPDIARDPDRSMNYKNVGGSAVDPLAARVAAVALGLDPLAVRVALRLQADIERRPPEKEGGEDLIPAFNKEQERVVQVKKETIKENPGKYGPAPEEDNEGPARAKAQLSEMAKEDPAFASILKDFTDEKKELFHLTKGNPGLPAEKFLKGKKLPEGIKTLGDIQNAMMAKPPTAPKKKGPKGQPKPQQPPAQGEGEAPKPVKNLDLKEAPKPAPAEEAKKPEEAPAAGEAKPPATEEHAAFPLTKKKEAPESGAEPEEAPSAPPNKPDDDGGSPFDDPTTKAKKKEQQEALTKWFGEKGHKSKDFKEWAQGQKTIGEGKNGEPLFRGPKKSQIPFEQLPLEAQLKVKSQFDEDTESAGHVTKLKDLAKDPEVKKVLKDLANPESELRRSISGEGDPHELDVSKSIGALKGTALAEHFSNVGDLLNAADKLYAPPPEPKRAKPTKQEQQRAQAAIKENLPEEMADEVRDMRLHPNDVATLIDNYKAAMSKQMSQKRILDIAGKLKSEPDEIEAPDEHKGKPLEDLTPEERGEAHQEHKLKMIALHHAAKAQLEKSVADSGAPPHLAKTLAHAMMSDHVDVPDTAVENYFKKVLTEDMGADREKPLNNGDVKRILDSVKDHPAAQKLAVAYMQARDYADAREKYLESSSKEHISEWQTPAEIAKGIEDASEFISARGGRYPNEAIIQDPGMEFRNRVMDRLNTLAPGKVPFIRGYVNEIEAKDFRVKKKVYEKRKKEYDRQVAEAELSHASDSIEPKLGEEPEGDYRTNAKRPEKPKKPPVKTVEERLAEKGIAAPRPPARPHAAKPEHDDEDENEDLWDWFKDFHKKKTKGKKAFTTAERALIRYLIPSQRQRVAFLYRVFSYTPRSSMGESSSDHAQRTAVYWGVEPYPAGQEGFAPYPKWEQAHARDIGETALNSILAAAKTWLKTPVLSVAVEGIVPDTQYRAALDLALRDHENGKYSAGLHPALYNDLLAKLAGTKPLAMDTLLTQRTAETRTPTGITAGFKFTYGDAPGEVPTMKATASAKILSLASRYAASNPDVAYELVALASEVSSGEVPPEFLEQQKKKKEESEGQGQEKQAALSRAATAEKRFADLRTIVIRTAAAFPAARDAFLPILQALKG